MTKPKPHNRLPIFCPACREFTKYDSYRMFTMWHLHVVHKDLTDKQFYDLYMKQSDQGICKVCSKETKFLNIVKGYFTYCCTKCTQADKSVREKIEKTNLERYGNKCSALNEDVIAKRKETCLEKYGVENYAQTEERRNQMSGPMEESKRFSKMEKTKKTNIEKYGVENTFQSEIFKEKIKETCLEKYGVDNYVKSEEYKTMMNKIVDSDPDFYKRKIIKTTEANINYGIERLKSKLPENYIFLNLLKEINTSTRGFKIKCPLNHEFEILRGLFNIRYKRSETLCTVCNEVKKNYSIMEKEVCDFVKSKYSGTVLENDHSLLGYDYEVDMYLPDLKLAIEFNGVYWHNEKNKPNDYHLIKTELCKELGVSLIHIYEDDWLYNQMIVESRLTKILSKFENYIDSSECMIETISSEEANEFLIDNDLHTTSEENYINIGMFYKEDLVSVLVLKQSLDEENFELISHCNILDNEINSFESLFKYFIDNFKYEKITYSHDRSWKVNQDMMKVGFKMVNFTKPNLWYVLGQSRFKKYQKFSSKLYDSGSLLFQYTNAQK